jgi:hypothetical protein
MQKRIDLYDQTIRSRTCGRIDAHPPASLHILTCAITLLLVLPACVYAQITRPLLEPDDARRTPFPSDRFTVFDPNQITGQRVNLPLPDCSVHVSDCKDLAQINRLDGFSLNPRLSIPFDGPIDPATVNSNSVFLLPIARGPRAFPVGIDQIIWNPGQNTVYAKPAALLDQHSRYALIVTDGIRDPQGTPIRRSRRLGRVATSDPHISEALAVARRAGIPSGKIISASVFTTQTVTTTMERIRDQIKAATPEQARFDLGPNGARTVFPLSEVTSLTYAQHTRTNPETFNSIVVPLATPVGGVSTVAFGKYRSPDYRVHPGEFIPATATRNGIPAVQSTNDIYFNLYLPAGPKPPGGWPVAIYGHGGGGHKAAANNVVGSLASRGIVTVTINAVGHGFGEKGTYTVARGSGPSVTFPAGGRGIDQNGDGVIADREGIRSAPPQAILDDRDGFRQTVVDLMQLIRIIEAGVDVDGDNAADLDPSRIYYLSQSLGGNWGTILLALEPNIRAAVLTVPPGTRTWRRLSGTGDRAFYGNMLAARQPSLVNAPGVNQIAGVAVSAQPLFNENMPLPMGAPLDVRLEDGSTQRIASPVIDRVPGAFDLQTFFDRAEWTMQPGDAGVYAAFIRKQPLPGMQPKPVIIQFAKGDPTAPNPGTVALLRAGELEGFATLYRHDLAFADNPALPKNPHGFMQLISNYGAIARGAQEQIAIFFESDGTKIIHPEPTWLFETPVVRPLPATLDYIP